MSMLDKNCEAACQDTRLQDALAERIVADFADSRLALLKAGLRGGKMLVAARVALLGGFKHVALLSATADAAKSAIGGLIELIGEDHNYAAAVVPPSWSTLENTLIIVDDVMWVGNSFDRIQGMMVRFPRSRFLAIGSRGPEYDKDLRWQTYAGYSATAWDLNPNIKFSDLLADCRTDPERFIRDYCAF